MSYLQTMDSIDSKSDLSDQYTHGIINSQPSQVHTPTNGNVHGNVHGNNNNNPNHHERGPSLDTNNIDFGNYFDLFSEPVKKLLKTQLEEKLDRKRRPTIDQLQDRGIWQPPDPNGPTLLTNSTTIHHIVPTTNPIPTTLPSTAVPLTGVSEQHELSRHLNKWVASRRRTIHELEKRGVLQKNYFTHSSHADPTNNNNSDNLNNDPNNITTMDIINETQQQHQLINGKLLVPNIYGKQAKQLSIESDGNTDGNTTPPAVHYHSLYSIGNIKGFTGSSSLGVGTDSIPITHANMISHAVGQSMESVHSVLSTALSDLDSNSDIELMENDLYHTHSHQILTHNENDNTSNQNNTNFKYNNTNIHDRQLSSQIAPIKTTSPYAEILQSGTNKTAVGNGFEHVYYYSIPEHLDGGMLSSWIFLPYKQWCEEEVKNLMRKYDLALTEMKNQSQLVHSSTSMGNDDDLYGGGGGGGTFMNMYDEQDIMDEQQKQIHAKRQSALDPHIERLMDIEQRLSDNKEKSKKIYKIHANVKNIQKQFDTHLDRLRADQAEMLDIVSEMKERYDQCNRTLVEIRNAEVWLITNIADTIAERSEKMDSMIKNIRKTKNHSSAERQLFSAEYDLTKQFVDELLSLIHELQGISDNKNKEVERLKDSINLLQSQNRQLNYSSRKSSNVVLTKLHQLQTHYKLPDLIDDSQDVIGRTQSILSAIDAYCGKVETNDYFSRSLELYQSACIHSDENRKMFFSSLFMNCSLVLTDAEIVYEFVNTNQTYAHTQTDEQNGINTTNEMTNNMKNMMNDSSLYDVNEIESQQSRNSSNNSDGDDIDGFGDDARETQHKLDLALTPIELKPLYSSVSFVEQEFFMNMNDISPERLLKYCLDDYKLDGIEIIKSLSENFCQNNLHKNGTKQHFFNKYNINLLKKIGVLASWSRKMPHKETVLSSVAQQLTIKFKQQIEQCNSKEEIVALAMKHCKILMSTALCTSGDLNGVIKSMRRCRKSNTNVYKMAALILYKTYNMACPCPV